MPDPPAPALAVLASRPASPLAAGLVAAGIRVDPLPDDEGDAERYVVSARLAVDRRTGHTFVAGILDKSLFTSAIFLREHFATPVLLVEGQVDYEHRGLDPQAVRGALSSLVVEYGLSVLCTPDLEESARLLAMLVRQEQAGVPEISLVPKRKAASLPDLQRRVVEMLPGCGRAMARELLQHFGSIERLAAASVAELRAVRGVGPAKADQMRRVLTVQYEAIDTERQVEDAVAAAPELLFDDPVQLLARQHSLRGAADDRQVVDLVFLHPVESVVVLVELKRSRLQPEDVAQLQRYLEHAPSSALVAGYLSAGWSVRGILASPEPVELCPQDPRIEARQVDAERVLGALRRQRRAAG